jgi:propionyl-CoA synthetase
VEFEVGQCYTCRHAKTNQTRRGTTYLRCLRASWDARLVKYPQLPVRDCPGHELSRPPSS